MSDPTFTGRDEIWRFRSRKSRPDVRCSASASRRSGACPIWPRGTLRNPGAYRASDAHNGYLNLAVTTGLVGLSRVADPGSSSKPLADLRRACARGADPALTMLFLQIWIVRPLPVRASNRCSSAAAASCGS